MPVRRVIPYSRHRALKLLHSKAACANSLRWSSTVRLSHGILITPLFVCFSMPLFYHRTVYHVFAHLYTMLLHCTCPHRPAGCDARAVGKNAHACSVDTPGRCGYRPLHGIRREWAFNHKMFLRNCRNFTKSALPSSLLMCYTDRNKTAAMKPTGNGGKSFRKGMFP